MTDSPRRPVREKLVAAGLVGGPRRDRGEILSWETPVRRLREVLESQGGVYCAFGSYLASRPDLLPLRDCLELSGLRDRRPPTPLSTRLRAEVGAAAEDLFRRWEELPYRRSSLHQWHRAELADGPEVTVKVVREEARSFPAEAPGLRVLEEVVACHRDWTAFDPAVAVSGFVDAVAIGLDLTREADELEDLAEEVSHFGNLVVPAVVRDRCAGGVLTVELPEGDALNDLAGIGGPRVGETARRLCQGWLEQALLRGLFPVEPALEDLVALPDRRLAILGGPFSRLEENARRHALFHLVAAVRGEPDRAVTFLLREVHERPDAVERSELRTRLRQAEPFRDGGWGGRFRGDRLGAHLFVQWRLLAGAGYRPRPGMVALMRGVLGLEEVVRRLAPDRDALREGMEDLRVVAAAAHLRRELAPSRMTATLERVGPVIGDLLARSEEVTTRAEEGRLRATKDQERNTGGASWPFIGGGLLLLGSIAALGAVAAGAGSSGGERLAVVAFAAVAVALLGRLRTQE